MVAKYMSLHYDSFYTYSLYLYIIHVLYLRAQATKQSVHVFTHEVASVMSLNKIFLNNENYNFTRKNIKASVCTHTTPISTFHFDVSRFGWPWKRSIIVPVETLVINIHFETIEWVDKKSVWEETRIWIMSTQLSTIYYQVRMKISFF